MDGHITSKAMKKKKRKKKGGGGRKIDEKRGEEKYLEILRLGIGWWIPSGQKSPDMLVIMKGNNLRGEDI